ncbi:MAG: GNAT family N-acetyltransferase [Armatimonadetes bacterium]|nr:GNAT family N-acetyltransferase [Armatimonadota bacterium]
MHEQVDILTTRDFEPWKQALEEVGNYDFHHLPSYHRLAEMRGEGDAFMLVYRTADCLIVFPLLLKEINLPCSKLRGFKDATSVHGYAGPLCSKTHVSEDISNRFLRNIGDFYRSNNVVTAFTRLHPLFDQAFLLRGCGEITEIGVTVSIDLTQPPEEQRSRYRKSHRYEIERLRKKGFTCCEVGPERTDEFVRIYNQTMLDLKADDFYLYDRAYFDYLIGDMADVTHLFMCLDGDNVACVGLFATCQGIIQYHLAGTATRYRKLAPMKLLLDTVRDWGNEIDATTLHLGGGLGAKRDSLYEFKMGFGSVEHTYTAWRMVIDSAIYRELCHDAQSMIAEELDNTYFPIYRNPILHEKTS